MFASPRGPSVRFVLRAGLRFGRAFLAELSAEHAVLILARRLEPGTSLFLDLHTLDPRLSHAAPATVTRADLVAPGRWRVVCRFELPLNPAQVAVARAA
jgi:hypothetical protein